MSVHHSTIDGADAAPAAIPAVRCPSVFVFLFVFFANLVGDSFLVLAFLDQFFITYGVPGRFLGFANSDVLPRRRRLGHLIITVCHGLRLANRGRHTCRWTAMALHATGPLTLRALPESSSHPQPHSEPGDDQDEAEQ
jgi:hypothetical protein